MSGDLLPGICWLAGGLVFVSAVVAFHFILASKRFSSVAPRLPYLPSRIPLVGNTLALAKNMDRYHEWLAENSLSRDGKPFMLHLLGKNDVMYTARPEHFEEVLKTQSSNFIKSDSIRDIFDDLLGESVVLLNGEEWLFHRKVFANLITTRALREYMAPVIQEKTLLLQQVLKEKSETKQPFDLYKLMLQFTLDTFSEIAFGCNLELLSSGKEHPFEVAFDEANRLSSERFTKPTSLWKFQRFLNIGNERRLREAIRVMNKFTVDLIMEAMGKIKNAKPDEAGVENTAHKNIMAILLSKKEAVTPIQVRDIVLTSLEAGRNTTSDTLAWFFHSLSQRPHVERKLRAEIRSKLPQFEESASYVPSYEEVQDLPYLEATLREALRLHPTVPSIPYHCQRDTVLQDGTFISAGTDVFLHLYSAGRLPSVWGPDAASFNPERFIDPSTGQLLPSKYSPFSSGPRVCIGRNLALLEMKIAIATVVGRFRLCEEPGQDVRPILDLTLTMKNPLMMRVEAASKRRRWCDWLPKLPYSRIRFKPVNAKVSAMLASGVTYGVMIATLVAVAAYAIIVSRRMEVNSVKNFVSAKNSTTSLRLAWCFFSAGMGSWTLFSFPQIGVDAGSWGVIGYTLSGVCGMLVLAVVGPYTRSALGENVTMTDVVAHRFGYVIQVYIGLISVFYQFISLASELTCVAQLTTMLSPNAHSLIPILVVVFLTNLYLIIGGLRASLATDVWQGIGVIALLAVVCIAMCFHVSIPDGAWSRTNVAAFTVEGFETLVTLVIAVTASNLFFTGFWQRVYAAYDDHTLRKAAFMACGIIIPFTVALALAGMVSYLAYPDGVLFFAILMDMGRGWEVLIVIVIAMLASGVSDSIQIGIAAELTTCFPKLSLLHARIIVALLNVPAIVIGYQQYDILNLFLIADLLCTAAVGPMLLGVWKRATRTGALVGSAAGLITIFICGVIAQGKFVGGFNWFILPEGLYSQNSMITFIVTLIIPPIVTVVVSLMTPKSEDPADGSYLLQHSPIQATKD